MPDVVFAVPGDLRTLTGGYIYDRRLIELLPQFGWNVRHIELPGDYPVPSEASLNHTAQVLAALAQNSLVVIDGLALGAMPSDLLNQSNGRIVGLVHHPLAFETGLSKERAQYLANTERAALSQAAHVIVTSAATAKLLATDFGLSRQRISIAEPGVDRAPRGHGGHNPPRLLSVGSISPRKGHEILVESLTRVLDLAWECHIVGSLDRDAQTAKIVREAITRNRLESRITLLGAISPVALSREYHQADLYLSASHYEGYGMALTEAMSRGLPIVGCAGGAVSSTVPADAGILVEPGNVAALAVALRNVLSDPLLRSGYGDAAWRYARTLPSWEDTAVKFADALHEVHAATR